MAKSSYGPMEEISRRGDQIHTPKTSPKSSDTRWVLGSIDVVHSSGMSGIRNNVVRQRGIAIPEMRTEYYVDPKGHGHHQMARGIPPASSSVIAWTHDVGQRQ